MRRTVSNLDRIIPPISGLRWNQIATPVVGLMIAHSAIAGDDVLELTPPLDAPAVTTPPRLVNPTRLPIVSTPVSPLSQSSTLTPIPLPTVAPALEAEKITTEPATASPVLINQYPVRKPVASTPRAVLAIPGMTSHSGVLRPMPSFSNEKDAVSPEPLSPSQPDPAGLTLDGPIEMQSAPVGAWRDPISPFPDLGSDRQSNIIPLTDSSGEGKDLISSPDSDPLATPSRKADSANLSPHVTPQPVTPTPRRRFFGLFPGPAVATPARSSTIGSSTLDARPIVDHLSPEAIAEARLKQRIEKQARDSIGDRVQSIDVKVVGKSATIHARGVRFYQKRGVRRAIENIPALSGLRSTVEVDD